MNACSASSVGTGCVEFCSCRLWRQFLLLRRERGGGSGNVGGEDVKGWGCKWQKQCRVSVYLTALKSPLTPQLLLLQSCVRDREGEQQPVGLLLLLFPHTELQPISWGFLDCKCPACLPITLQNPLSQQTLRRVDTENHPRQRSYQRQGGFIYIERAFHTQGKPMCFTQKLNI